MACFRVANLKLRLHELVNRLEPLIVNLAQSACLFAATGQGARLPGEDTTGLPVWETADRATQAERPLKEKTGIPMGLHELEVKVSDLCCLAEARAQVTRLLRLNSRPLDADPLERSMQRAM